MNRHRRMRDPVFRQQQWVQRYAPHIAPVNRLVDHLCDETDEEKWMPCIAPIYGGINATILFLFQDPGPKIAKSAEGGGFLCVENNDPTAQRFAECMDAAGLAPSRVITWNAYPWFRSDQTKAPTPRQLEKGVDPMMRLLALLTRLHVVALMGRCAEDDWRRACRSHIALGDRYEVMTGLHTSNRGILARSSSRAEGEARVIAMMLHAREIIDGQTMAGRG